MNGVDILTKSIRRLEVYSVKPGFNLGPYVSGRSPKYWRVRLNNSVFVLFNLKVAVIVNNPLLAPPLFFLLNEEVCHLFLQGDLLFVRLRWKHWPFNGAFGNYTLGLAFYDELMFE